MFARSAFLRPVRHDGSGSAASRANRMHVVQNDFSFDNHGPRCYIIARNSGKIGAVAQLGEHKAGSLGVRGSIPLSSTKTKNGLTERSAHFVFGAWKETSRFKGKHRRNGSSAAKIPSDPPNETTLAGSRPSPSLLIYPRSRNSFPPAQKHPPHVRWERTAAIRPRSALTAQ